MSPVEADGKEAYFTVASALEKDVFLRLSREIVEDALLLCAPLGGSRLMRRVTPTEAAFFKAYGPCWRASLEGVTEIAYSRQNVSEGEVAVTIQHLVQEDGDEEAASAVRAMASALSTIYSPPAVVELPRILAPKEFTDFAEQLHTLAAPAPARSAAAAAASACGTAGLARAIYPEVFVALGFQLPGQGPVEAKSNEDAIVDLMASACGDAAAPEDGVLLAAAKATAAATSAKERIRKAAVALAEAREREPARWDGMRQEHFQAIAEAYGAPDGGGLAAPGEAAAAAAAAAADAVASESFLFDPLFAAVWAAEAEAAATAAAATTQPDGSSSKEDGGGVGGSSNGDRLDDIYAAAHFARRAELLSVDEEPARAAGAYSEAVAVGFGAVPDCLLAGFIANRGLCRLAAAAATSNTATAAPAATRAALKDAQAALGLDRRCAAAYACRGRCRRLGGDASGGMRDSVRSHVLEAAAGTGEAAEGGPKAAEIEAAARAAVEAAAAAAFAKRQPAGKLPPQWLIRSYFESFGGEDGDEARESDFLQDNFGDGGEEEKDFAAVGVEEPLSGSSGAAAFCRGQLHLGYEHKQAREYERAYGFFAAAAAAAAAGGSLGGDTVGDDQTAEKLPPRLASRALEENASFLHLRGDHGAAESFRAAVDVDPANGMARVKLGAVLADMGRKREALAEFATVLADTEGGLYDGDAKRRRAAAAAAFLHRGQLRLLEGENMAAAADFERSVALDGDIPASAASWGIALFKEAQAAAAAAEAATAAGAGVGESAARRASAATERALGVLATAVDEFPDALEPRLFYAEALTQAGDFGGALGLLKEAAGLGGDCGSDDGDDAGSDDGSSDDGGAEGGGKGGGKGGGGAGGDEKAASSGTDGDEEGASGGVGDGNRCPLPYAFAGRAYLALNDVAAARRHLQRALQIDPGCSSALLDMGQLHMQEGDTAAALRLYRLGVQSSRYLSEMHDALACFAIAMAHVQALAEFAE